MGGPNKETAGDALAITLNGDPYQLDGNPRLSKLIERLNMRSSRIAVELNGKVVPKAQYDATMIRAGDVLEIINFVGGG